MGMITKDEAILQLYAGGQIDEEMAIQFSEDPETMSMKVNHPLKRD